MKRIVITGGSGLLGTNWAVARRDCDEIHLILHERDVCIDGVSTHFVDLSRENKINDILSRIKPDLIIHTAALTDVDLCEKQPNMSYSSNVETAKNVASQAFCLGIPMVHISTDHLFDGSKTVYHEGDSTSPVNIYGQHKVLAETFVQEAHPEALIIRTCFFGWGTKYRRSFSDFIIDALKLNKNISLFDDVFFTPVHIADLVRVVHDLVGLRCSGVFNVSSSDSISKYEFGVILAKSMGLDAELIQPIQASRLRNRVKRPKNLSLSNQKTQGVLNCNGISVTDTVDSLKKNGSALDVLSLVGNIIPYGRHFVDDDDVSAVRETLLFGSLTQGPSIERFESEIAELTGAKYAVAVSSATAGLHISYKALGVKPGKTVLVSPITFVSTANAAYFCGSEARFADINKNTLNMSSRDALASIEAFPDIHLVAPTLFAGSGDGILDVANVAKKFSKYVVEDAAHGLGGRYPCGAMIGSCKYSDCTVFSLHPVKSIAAGEGGLVTTNDETIYRHLLRLRSHGINKTCDNFQSLKDAMTGTFQNPWYYEMNELGFHYRFTDIQASLASSQLTKLQKFMLRRRDLVRKYTDWINSTLNVSLAQSVNVDNSANHLLPVKFDFEKLKINRCEIMAQLKSRGIITQVHYIPVINQPFYERQGFVRTDFPNSQEYYNGALSLPLYYGLTDHELEFVLEQLSSILEQKA